MKKILLFCILIFPSFIKAQIGIGTDTPSPDAVLDVNSTNKGLKLPRLNNTSVVNKPSAGLMIYDKSTNAPAFYDGIKWNSMIPLVVGTDSMTYILTFVGNRYSNREFPLQIISMEVPVLQDSTRYYYFNITKPHDLNTDILIETAHKQRINDNGGGSGGRSAKITLEIKIYNKETKRHYFSYKFTDLRIPDFLFSELNGGTNQSEYYYIEPNIFGWKDNVTGKSIAFDVVNHRTVDY